MIGDRTMNTAIFWKPLAISALQPAAATAAPLIAPTSACEELVGSPKYQVIRSQMIAPLSPAKITPLLKISGFTTSLAIVAATAVPNTRNAAKLKNAAQTTAWRGESTRVDTTVAIELAASWNPLMKSNPSAIAMMRTTAIDMDAMRASARWTR